MIRKSNKKSERNLTSIMKRSSIITGQDRTGQDRTGQDRTGQDRTGLIIRLRYHI